MYIYIRYPGRTDFFIYYFFGRTIYIHICIPFSGENNTFTYGDIGSRKYILFKGEEICNEQQWISW